MHQIKQGSILAFGEIFLKSAGVQKELKKRLMANLYFFLKKEEIGFKIHSFRERIFVETKDFRKSSRIFKKSFGIVWFGRAYFLKNACLEGLNKFIKENYKDWIKKNQTFALRVKKDPGIRQTREKIIERIAKNIQRKVNLDRPNKEIFVEARKTGYFLYFKKQKAPGGLPAGSQGRVLTLISGGIDSPAASFLMAKRGAKNLWLHFHSFPLVSKKSIEKVKDLAKIFLNYQPHLKIFFVPFHRAQMEIKTKTLPKYRVLLYRRLMFKIAKIIAKKERCHALVTGESLGQVSSQTLPNLQIIENGIKIPVFRPLIGMNKEEIISLAKKIESFKISIMPQEDCCSLFVPKHATAYAKIEKIKELENNLDIKALIKKSIQEIEIKQY